MFDIGFWELLVVALIGLIILGPERLPRAVRSLQVTLGKVRQFGSRMEAEINHELRVKELHDNLRKIESAEDLDNLPDELKKSMEELQRAAASVNRPYAQDTPAKETPAADSPATDTQATDTQATDTQGKDTATEAPPAKDKLKSQNSPHNKPKEPRDDAE